MTFAASFTNSMVSKLDKSKLTEMGFEPLPTWQDAVKRYLEEANL